jgi:hypothetical protein
VICLSNKLLLRTLPLFAAGLGLAALSGCGRGDVTAYDIPKEAPPAQAMPGSAPGADPHAGIAAARPSVNWGELPEGWTPTGQASGMRLATFTIAGADGQSAEVAIIPMGGFAGTDDQLVNMWRSQLGLPELAQAEAGEQGEPFIIGGVEGNIYEMAGTTENSATRMVVASANSEGVNYFFKLIGHDALVASKKDEFLKFLEGVDFDAAMPATAPPPMAGHPPSAGDQRWTAPDSWEELPPSQFLLAKYRIPGEAGANATVTVSQLGGDAGGLLPNVNRWRAQLNLGPVDEAGLQPLLSTVKSGSLEATLVTLEGTDLQSGAPGKMLTVVVSLPSESWFFKLTGPVAVVDQHAGDFEAFVSAARF